MQRISASTNTDDNNLFTEGDPQGGVAPTEITQEWLNAVQEELAEVVEAASLTLDPQDNTQLLAALVAGFGLSKDLSSDGYATLPGGLIIQWGLRVGAVTGASVTFPIAFPNNCLEIFATDGLGASGDIRSSDPLGEAGWGNKTTTGFTIYSSGSASWLAIGH